MGVGRPAKLTLRAGLSFSAFLKSEKLSPENWLSEILYAKLGSKWKEAGSTKPSGTEIKNELLAAALQKQVEFTKEEWEKFQVADLSIDSYVKAGDRYLIPAAEKADFDLKEALKILAQDAETEANENIRLRNLADNALYMSYQDLSAAGMTEDLLLNFSYRLNIIAATDGVTKTFNKVEFDARLKSLPLRIQQLMERLLQGSWLGKTKWRRCEMDPPRCGNITADIYDVSLPKGTLTDYQVGHASWPSCSDFNRQAVRNNLACSSLDLTMKNDIERLFTLMDRDQSDFLDRNELESLEAELEARRRVAEKEVWARMHMSQRDLFKIKALGHGFEFASPKCATIEECADVRYSTTLRMSSWSEWFGEYLRLGFSRNTSVSTCSVKNVSACGKHFDLQPCRISTLMEA
jgi:hypothetical protein